MGIRIYFSILFTHMSPRTVPTAHSRLLITICWIKIMRKFLLSKTSRSCTFLDVSFVRSKSLQLTVPKEMYLSLSTHWLPYACIVLFVCVYMLPSEESETWLILIHTHTHTHTHDRQESVQICLLFLWCWRSFVKELDNALGGTTWSRFRWFPYDINTQ